MVSNVPSSEVSITSITPYKKELEFFKTNSYSEIKSTISYEFMEKLVKVLENPHLRNLDLVAKGDWCLCVWRISIIEHCFRKSEEFTLEKASSVFLQFFESVQKQGFDVNLPLSPNDYTALGWATEYRAPAVITALIEAGADVNGGKRHPLVHIMGESNVRPKPPYELVEQCFDILVKNGCNPNSLVEKDKVTPLWIAAIRGDSHNLIRSLVKAKADVNVKTGNLDATPLQAALKCSVDRFDIDDSLPTVKTLVELGADIFAADGRKVEFKIANYLNKIAYPMKQTQTIFLNLDFIPKVLKNIVLEYLFGFSEESDQTNEEYVKANKEYEKANYNPYTMKVNKSITVLKFEMPKHTELQENTIK